MTEAATTWTDRVWVCDSEVFAHDTLWVFEKLNEEDEILEFHNDPKGVQAFLRGLKDPILCGFNIKHYDIHILRATLLGWSPEDHKALNDYIIQRGMQGWMAFDNTEFVKLPAVVDLIQDVVPYKSLKEIEANLGFSIVESSVPFNLDRPWTPEETEEVTEYCKYDVSATKKLFTIRRTYLDTKLKLAEIAGVDPDIALGLTNAKLVAAALGAREAVFHTSEYVIPSDIDTSRIPQAVLDFVTPLTSDSDPSVVGHVEVDIAGCPAVVGLGGIHAALPTYAEQVSPERVILIQDIASYYPSLILKNGYMSRACESDELYRQFYDMRLKAKADGDKATAEAAKLVLNTAFGAMKEPFNKLYDPIQGTSICVSGQLYIIDLMVGLKAAVPSLKVIQLNTDGWVVSLDRTEAKQYVEAFEEWKNRTGFQVEDAAIEQIHQRDVNNYIMRMTDGAVKSKGAVFAAYPNGSFKGNSFGIIGEAVANELLDGVPVKRTVDACSDIHKFQLVHKAGSAFTHCEWMGEDVGKCVRIYASKVASNGKVFKVGRDGDRRKQSAIPNCPTHAFVDKENTFTLEEVDRSFYSRLAKKKVKEFSGAAKEPQEERLFDMAGKQTEEVSVPVETTEEAYTAYETVVPGAERAEFYRKYLELKRLMSEHKGFIFDRAVENIDKSYVDTQQYKVALEAYAQVVGIAIEVQQHSLHTEIGAIVYSGSKAHDFKYEGEITYTDIRTGYSVSHSLVGEAFNSAHNGALAAGTFALRGYIINNFMLDNGGRGNDEGLTAAPEVARKMSAGSQAPVAPQTVVSAADSATEAFLDSVVKVYRAVTDKEPEYAKELDLSILYAESGALRTDIPKPTAVKLMNKLERKAHALGIEV